MIASLKEVVDALKKEFADIRHYPRLPIESAEAIAVLCAEEVDLSGENWARFETGLKLLKRCGQKVSLIFLGTRIHNAHVQKYVAENRLDSQIYYPTNYIFSTSRTQLKSLDAFLRKKKLKSVLIVSHAYHIPRLRRNCLFYLSGVDYDFYPVGKITDQTRQIDAEIAKIIAYAKKGDVPLRLD